MEKKGEIPGQTVGSPMAVGSLWGLCGGEENISDTPEFLVNYFLVRFVVCFVRLLVFEFRP